jgi:hypothetical protein
MITARVAAERVVPHDQWVQEKEECKTGSSNPNYGWGEHYRRAVGVMIVSLRSPFRR